MKDPLRELRKELADDAAGVQAFADRLLAEGILNKAERGKVEKLLEKPASLEELEVEMERAHLAAVMEGLESIAGEACPEKYDELLLQIPQRERQKQLIKSKQCLDDSFCRFREEQDLIREVKKLFPLDASDNEEAGQEIRTKWPIERIFEAFALCVEYRAPELDFPCYLEPINWILQEAHAYIGAYLYSRIDGDFDYFRSVDMDVGKLTISEIKERIPPSVSKCMDLLLAELRATRDAAEGAEYHSSLAAAKTIKELNARSENGKKGNKVSKATRAKVSQEKAEESGRDKILSDIRNALRKDTEHSRNYVIRNVLLKHREELGLPADGAPDFKRRLDSAVETYGKALYRAAKNPRGNHNQGGPRNLKPDKDGNSKHGHYVRK